MNNETIVMQPIATIQVPDVILRQPQTDNEKYITMQASIRAIGRPDMPIVLRTRVLETGTIVELVDGRQRLEICKNLGFETIPAIFKEMGDADAIATQIRLNMARVDQNPMEVAKALAKMVAMDSNLTSDQLAEKTGCTKKFIEDRLRLASIQNPETRELISKGAINIGNATLLAKAPKEVQDKLVDHAQTQTTAEFTSTVAASTADFNKKKAENPQPKAEATYDGPVASRKSLEDLQAAATNSDLVAGIVKANEATTAEQGFVAGLLFAINIDATGKAEQKAKWDAKLAEKKAKEEEKAAQKLAKEEMAKALKDGGKNPLLTQIDAEKADLAKKEKAARQKMMDVATKLVADGVCPTIGDAIAHLRKPENAGLLA